ncbi:MAG TPA: hypothetical protein VHO07_17630, partial [Streptosporangiaceae bacterium]|nr:hypothetical protein [Streptosporangiaceae bacterium]
HQYAPPDQDAALQCLADRGALRVRVADPVGFCPVLSPGVALAGPARPPAGQSVASFVPPADPGGTN